MRFTLIISFLFSSFCSLGQELTFVCQDSVKGDFDRFSVDNLGRIYLVQEDVIIQFNSDLDTLFTASLKSIRPTSIQSSKSFRTLLFDEERSIVQFLDNTLTDLHGNIDLVNLDIQQAILACESFGGDTFWVLDAASLRLIRLNEKLEKVVITENLVTIFNDATLPTQMKEVNDFLYILIPGKGVALFDVFGTFMTLYPCQAERIDALGNSLLVLTKDELHIVSVNTILEKVSSYPLPFGVRDFVFTHKKIYLLTDEGLYIGGFKSDH